MIARIESTDRPKPRYFSDLWKYMTIPLYELVLSKLSSADVSARLLRRFSGTIGPNQRDTEQRPILRFLSSVRREMQQELQKNRGVPRWRLSFSLQTCPILRLLAPLQSVETNVFARGAPGVFRQAQGSCNGENWI